MEFECNSILGRSKLLDRGEWLALRFGRSDPGETVKSSVFSGGFADCRDGLEVLEKKTNLSYCWESNPDLGDVSLVFFSTHLPDTRNVCIRHCRFDDFKTTSVRFKIISVIIHRFQIICKFKLRIFH